MACCGRKDGEGRITVTFPDGSVRVYATRPEAVAAVTRAGGGVITGA
jgi:hypothetical protein